MSFGIVVASHGELAAGIKHSADMVFGAQEKTEVVTFLPSQGPEDVHHALTDAITRFGPTDDVLLLADLWGGTPFNQASVVLSEVKDRKVGLITGLNLPMLIQAYTERLSADVTLEKAMASIVKEAKIGVRVPPESVQPEGLKNSASTAKQGKALSSTSSTSGSLKINLVRIDSRLLHGQVATAWTPDSKANRIIVVSDTVAKDTLRKKLIEQAAPPGVKANVIPIQKMIEAAKSPILGDVRALLLFENPQDLLKTIEGGVPIKVINVGQMVNTTGKTQISHTLSMDKEDVATFEKLRDLGVEFDVRKVPSDSKQNLFALIEKATIK